LQSICLPVSLRAIHGRAFVGSAITHIEIESGNEFFVVRGHFIVGIQPPISLVCYFGRASEIAVDDDIEALAADVFA
jgi:hypothetical protein